MRSVEPQVSVPDLGVPCRDIREIHINGATLLPDDVRQSVIRDNAGHCLAAKDLEATNLSAGGAASVDAGGKVDFAAAKNTASSSSRETGVDVGVTAGKSGGSARAAVGYSQSKSSLNEDVARQDSSGDIALWALREVNDDQRLIIESSAFDDTDELAERLVPLRHRCTRLLEAANIECRWQLEGLQACQLNGKRGLDFLRVLQEALANVLKHSGADHVDVRIEAVNGQLSLSVRDNGRGFAHETASRASGGMGLQNMHARAARLGGTLEIRSSAIGTTLEMRCPIDTAIAA